MPPHNDTPAEADGAPALSPAPVTRRQLREQEAKAALAARPAARTTVPAAAARSSASPARPIAAPATPIEDLFSAAAPIESAPARKSLFAAEPAKKASRTRRQRPHQTTAPAIDKPADTDVAAVRRSTVTALRKRMFSKLATVGAMAGVGLILISTTVPANAFIHPSDSITSMSTSLKSVGSASATQEMAVDAVAAPTLTRDSYTVVSAAQKAQARAGQKVLNYTNNPLGTIQWPFASGVTITSGFGPRQVAGCGFCSTYHQGLDFTPGSGTPIHIAADGVVSAVIVSNSGLGNHVIIDHVINGQKVQTVYAHMQYGSIAVAEGQAVTVGSIVGKVGSTGASTGAHLHFEVHLDGTPVDPYAWLQANAN